MNERTHTMAFDSEFNEQLATKYETITKFTLRGTHNIFDIFSLRSSLHILLRMLRVVSAALPEYYYCYYRYVFGRMRCMRLFIQC